MYKIRAAYLSGKNTYFDKRYYLDKHVPLANKHLDGKFPVEKIDLEWDVALLPEKGALKSHCVFNLYVRSIEEVKAFRNFFQSDASTPIKEDVVNYTNCTMEWTVSELMDV